MTDAPSNTQYQPPPPPRNSIGAAGFFVSAFGLLVLAGLTVAYFGELRLVTDRPAWHLIVVGVLSPLGLLVSAAGIFRFPKTLATAGVMLGLLGTLWLLTAGVMLVALEMDVFTDPKVLAQRQEQKSIKAVKDATELIQASVRQYGVSPGQELGNTIIEGMIDGWDRALIYLPRKGTEFELISAGPDGTAGTPDDITNLNVKKLEEQRAREEAEKSE